MSDLAAPAGPFVFDTSAESWLVRQDSEEVRGWVIRYLESHPVYVSAITVVERLNGYSAAICRAASEEDRKPLRARRAAYLGDPNRVLAIDAIVAAVAAELMAIVPDPPSPPKRSHRAVESRADRLARWRFDCLIAATALVNSLPLMHNNPEDFETLRMALEIDPARLPGFGPLSLFRCTRLAAGSSPAAVRQAAR